MPKLRLNLGCWIYPLDGFLNVDIHPNFGLEHWDITSPPYADNSVDEIYAGHVIEHFTPALARQAVSNWYSVLKPGAKLTLAFPDMDKAYIMYNNGAITLAEYNAILYGEVAAGFEPNMHKQYTDADTVMELLAECGFTSKQLKHSDYAVAHPAWQSIVEAVK